MSGFERVDTGMFPVVRNLTVLWRTLPLPRENEEATPPCVLCGARAYYTFLDEQGQPIEGKDDQDRPRFRIHHEPHDKRKHVPPEAPETELRPPARTGDVEEEDYE